MIHDVFDKSAKLLLIKVTGLHSEMAKAEAISAGAVNVIAEQGRLMLVNAERPDNLLRLGYSALVLEFLGRSAIDRQTLPFNPNHVIKGSYAIKAVREGYLGTSESLVKNLQNMVWNRLEAGQVDLTKPDDVLYAFLGPSEVWWGKLLRKFTAGEFGERQVQNRPFFRSFGIQPRKARCLVNLAGLDPGEQLLDPFCGTGSVLMEAAATGLRTFGSDVDPRMIEGSIRNLSRFGFRADVRLMDARCLEDWNQRFDALVTDVPYGISASLKGTPSARLYREFLEAARRVLVSGGKLVVMAPKGALRLSASDFDTLWSFEEYVHGSLTREILVARRL